ncbi:TlpA family protein disulfide reductase [Mucilaginibacter glaciei]|uniref:Redoxin domain-containing protein n=1 Tax=Mucilaginibacter glaciei TaxID=2772109 RepID=A0A926S286_9SPHI|nr:thioredoxin-like domain-containing protein [Mucilaginibacter glaciei]MBD1393597.1 redoxin domain-containing protein [Mucilaginibacter glaciei]
MKRILFALSFIIVAGCSRAQTIPTTIPTYKILTADSTYKTYADLKKDKPVMIVYFSPDCSHCQHLMNELKPKMNDLKKMQVVLIAFTRTEYPYLNLLRDFRKTYNLAKYPNVTMGTEYPTYKVQQFYQVKTTPFIAIYDHDGKLLKAYEKVPTMDELMASVKKA